MADKKIEISLEDKTPKASPSDAASAASSQEDKQLEKLAALWKKQEEQDKKDLENLFIESNKKLWERQDREEKQREDSAAYERSLELEASSKDIVKEMLASFGDIDIPNQLDLLADSSLGSLEEDIEAATQELLRMVDGTQEATTWIGRFSSMLSSSAQAAASALGGGGGGHGGKAGVFGAFGGGSAGISVGHSLAASALAAGGSLAILTGATLAYIKVVEKLAEMTGGMSGEVAAAQARAETTKIQDQLRLAREQGPQIANLVDQSTGIAHEGRAIIRELVGAFGPWLESGGEILRRGFELATVFTSGVNDFMNWMREKWNGLWGVLENIPIIGSAIKKMEEVYTRPPLNNGRTIQDDINSLFGSNEVDINEQNRRSGPVDPIDLNFM